MPWKYCKYGPNSTCDLVSDIEFSGKTFLKKILQWEPRPKPKAFLTTAFVDRLRYFFLVCPVPESLFPPGSWPLSECSFGPALFSTKAQDFVPSPALRSRLQGRAYYRASCRVSAHSHPSSLTSALLLFPMFSSHLFTGLFNLLRVWSPGQAA